MLKALYKFFFRQLENAAWSFVLETEKTKTSANATRTPLVCLLARRSSSLLTFFCSALLQLDALMFSDKKLY